MPSYHPSLYPNHPIQIPEELPKVLKLYTKAAIRTQPADLLLWSASYFRCMANGEQPPVKERLEYPLPQTWYGLTTGLVRVLHKQVGTKGNVHLMTLRSKWRGICLPLTDLDNILAEAKMENKEEIPWRPLLAFMAFGVAGKRKVDAAMKVVCEAMTNLSTGEGFSLNGEDFIEMFIEVANVAELGEDKIKEVKEYLETAAERQNGILSYENFKTELCPEI